MKNFLLKNAAHTYLVFVLLVFTEISAFDWKFWLIYFPFVILNDIIMTLYKNK